MDLEIKAKEFVDKNVQLTLKKINDCSTHTIIVKLKKVKQGFITFLKPSGMEYTYPLADNYFKVENIESIRQNDS